MNTAILATRAASRWRLIGWLVLFTCLAPDAVAVTRFKVLAPDRSVVISVRLGSRTLELRDGASDAPQTLIARATPGKREYKLKGGDAVLEVEPARAGYTVTAADGALKWSVELQAAKIKIADRGNDEAPYELGRKSASRGEVRQGGHVLGHVEFDPDTNLLKIKSASRVTLYRTKSKRLLLGFGVLLLEQIPARERWVLLAEMVSRGW